jgi:chromate transporter
MTDLSQPPEPSLLRLFLVFSRISLTSFGGGLSGWLLREVVTEREWISEEDFLNGLAVAQAMPGVNVTNMAIWIGYRLFGLSGVLVALVGIILPGAVAIILLATCFESVSRFRVTGQVLTGAAAAAIGLSLSMGITTARRLPKRPSVLIIMAAAFVAVAIFHWSITLVVLGLGAASTALSYRRLLLAPA